MIYTCDECLRGPLKTKRFRCQTCPEFDLCQQCFDANKHREDGHKFMPIAIDTDSSPDEDEEGENSSSQEEANSLPIFPRQSRYSSVDSVGRMDELLSRVHLRVPLAQISSTVSIQFLDLFEQIKEPIKQSESKKVRLMEQIMGRTALVLVGVKLRKTASLQKLVGPEPELVRTMMRGLMAQFLIFNQTVGECTDRVRKLVDLKRKLKFETFHADTMEALRVAERTQAKAARIAIAALEELREALGFAAVESAATPPTTTEATVEPAVVEAAVAPPAKTTTAKTKQQQQAKKKSLPPSQPVTTTAKRPRVEEEEEAKPEPVTKTTSPQPLLESPLDIIARTNQAMEDTSLEADEMRAQIDSLKEVLSDAHGRLDVIVHLLKECIGAPLQRGLDKLIIK